MSREIDLNISVHCPRCDHGNVSVQITMDYEGSNIMDTMCHNCGHFGAYVVGPKDENGKNKLTPYRRHIPRAVQFESALPSIPNPNMPSPGSAVGTIIINPTVDTSEFHKALDAFGKAVALNRRSY